jgi:hypothetical protein
VINADHSAIISRQALAQTAQDRAQSFICFMAGYLPHSVPQASQAFAHAAQMAADIGPRRAVMLAAAAQMSAQSSERLFDLMCSFMPAATIEAQCREQARHAFRQSLQALAQWAYLSPGDVWSALTPPVLPQYSRLAITRLLNTRKT